MPRAHMMIILAGRCANATVTMLAMAEHANVRPNAMSTPIALKIRSAMVALVCVKRAMNAIQTNCE